ncbi:MAG: DUF1778 domain-containing protein [Chlorobium sp.]|jgi:uncharacterized protein (DUF1778 family)|nr:DUF1778 domain-containing protein [Chlorobium sp.]
MSAHTAKTEKLDLRLSQQAKQVLRIAAIAAHRSVSEFVLESALARAEETLADRRSFSLNGEQWTAFIAALDAPPRNLPRVKKLFQEKSIFEQA